MSTFPEIKARLEAIVANTPGWEVGPGSADAVDAQQYAGEWRAPMWGCDSLDHLMDGVKSILSDWPTLTPKEWGHVQMLREFEPETNTLSAAILAILDKHFPPEEKP